MDERAPVTVRGLVNGDHAFIVSEQEAAIAAIEARK